MHPLREALLFQLAKSHSCGNTLRPSWRSRAMAARSYLLQRAFKGRFGGPLCLGLLGHQALCTVSTLNDGSVSGSLPR